MNNQKVLNSEISSKIVESSAKENSSSKDTLWFFLVLIAVCLLMFIILGTWWGKEPRPFDVQKAAETHLKITNTKSKPIGFVYTNTLAHIAEYLMHKPGGYISNDVTPPGMFLDNIRSWEYGALVMLRDGTTALRNHFARGQSQSIEDKDLAMAEPHFYYEPKAWALPSTESEYVKGVKSLHYYMQRIQNPRSAFSNTK